MSTNPSGGPDQPDDVELPHTPGQPDELSPPHASGDDPLGFGDARMDGRASGSDSDLDPDPDPELLREKLHAAEALAAERWDMLLRLQAESDNLQKRSAKQVSDARKFALEGFVNDLLPVKDSLEMGINAAREPEAGVASLLEGSELTLKMLAQVLSRHQVEEIDPVGEKFDPNLHQAMSMQPAEGVPSNTVTMVMQKGYTLNDRLVRPALVMVSR